MSKFQEKDIFSYLDGTMDAVRKIEFEEALTRDDSLKFRLEQLSMVHESLLTFPKEPAPSTLVDGVMKTVETLPGGAYSGSSIFSGTNFLVISGILTAIVAAISLFSSGYLSYEQIETTAQGYEVADELNLVKDLFSPKVMRNAMLVIYGVLSLALLDRAILNPLFRKRQRQLTV